MIKDHLKRFRSLHAVNVAWKSWKVKSAYRRTVHHYTRMKVFATAQELFARRAGDRIFLLRSFQRPLNIYFMGTDEQQDRGGTIQALEKLGKLEYFTRADGSYGQNHPGSPAERKKANTVRFREILREWEHKGGVPDVLIAQTWAGYIDPCVFDDLRTKYGTVIMNIAMDDRHQYWGEKVYGQWQGTYGLIPHIDLSLTAAPECVDWYLKEGCPSFYFPEASDPSIYHPMPELPKIHDVSFVGGKYGIREKLVNALRKAGVRVTACGTGWEGGRIKTEDVPRLFAQSKIVLGVGTIGHCDDFFALKMRDFDGPMSGSCYVTHDNSDLYQLFSIGKEMVTYRTIEDCIGKTKHLLNNDGEREQIAREGYARAVKDHTWIKRFESLFSLLSATGTNNNDRN